MGAGFTPLLKRVSSTVLRAMRHGSVPFPALVERLRPEYDPSRSPLFDTLFVYDRPQQRRHDGIARFVSGDGTVDLGGLVLRGTPLESTSTVYDLTLYAFDTTDALTLRWEYDRDLFDARTAARFASYYTAVLEQCLSGADRPLAELDGLPAADRRTLLTEWNGPTDRWPPPAAPTGRGAGGPHPQALAVVFEDRSLTYRELDRRAGQLAARLRREGVGPESLVGVCLPRSPELVVALLGVLKGAAYVPMDPEYPHERLRHLMTDSSAQVLITSAEGPPSVTGTASVLLSTRA
ncbi:AMP-binding protein [Streptomyces nogalater]